MNASADIRTNKQKRAQPGRGGSSVHRWLPADVVMRIRSLELRARIIVRGFRTGLNRSPKHGFSVEFSEYRQYAQGDDPRFIDWKLFARTDRGYVKLFEDETNLRCDLVVDTSRSMDFGTTDWTKLDYARTLAASVAWLLNKQGDAVGVTRFSDRINDVVPARYRPGQLRRLLGALDRPACGTATYPRHALEEAGRRLQRRGVVILFSDLLTDPAELEAGLKSLRGRLHQTAVIQILDPAETQFSFEGAALFVDAESDLQVHSDPARVRDDYLKQFHEHQAAVRDVCDRLGIRLMTVQTDDSPEDVLARFLHEQQIRS